MERISSHTDRIQRNLCTERVLPEYPANLARVLVVAEDDHNYSNQHNYSGHSKDLLKALQLIYLTQWNVFNMSLSCLNAIFRYLT